MTAEQNTQLHKKTASKQVQVSVIIPNYKGIDYIEGCLSSLYANAETKDTPAFEVLVVDNASKDGSVALIEEKFPRTKLLLLEENTGFCHAVNVGIQASKAPFVLLLNNDTKVDLAFVKELYEAICSDDSIFSAAAQMLLWDRPDLIDSAGDQLHLLGFAYGRGKGKPAKQYEKKRKVFSACGGAAIYRKEVLEKIGCFDELHFAYLEDVDLGWRSQIHGYKNIYAPKAKVIHFGSAATGSRYNAWKIRKAAANNLYMFWKNMPLLQLLLNLPFLLLGMVIKSLFFAKKGYGKSYLQGLLDGVGRIFSAKAKPHKVPFAWKHLLAYCRIQLMLIQNLFYC